MKEITRNLDLVLTKEDSLFFKQKVRHRALNIAIHICSARSYIFGSRLTHTIRYKFYHIAGKVVTHAQKLVLKVQQAFQELLESIRKKSYEVSLQ